MNNCVPFLSLNYLLLGVSGQEARDTLISQNEERKKTNYFHSSSLSLSLSLSLSGLRSGKGEERGLCDAWKPCNQVASGESCPLCLAAAKGTWRLPGQRRSRRWRGWGGAGPGLGGSCASGGTAAGGECGGERLIEGRGSLEYFPEFFLFVISIAFQWILL